MSMRLIQQTLVYPVEPFLEDKEDTSLVEGFPLNKKLTSQNKSLEEIDLVIFFRIAQHLH